MRIAILMPVNNTWSREVAIRLAEQGHEIHVVDFEQEVEGNYLRGRQDIHSAGIARLRERIASIQLIPGKSIALHRYVLYAPRLAKILHAIKADVLLTLWGGGFALIAYLSRFRPYAVYVGGGDILRVSGIQKAISSHNMSKAAVVFANGVYFAEETKRFAPAARVVPLYYGVDAARFEPGVPPAGPVKIVCTRGFSRPYNNEYIIRALQTMPRDVPDFRMVFTSTGELREQVQRTADTVLSPEMRRRVEFLNGVSDNQLLKNLQDAHIYTSASTYDGTSISLLEALACGLFPVLTDIPANREWIHSELRNGILVKLDDAASYGLALAQAIRDSKWRAEAAASNRQIILDRADSRRTMAKLAAILEQCCGISGDRAALNLYELS